MAQFHNPDDEPFQIRYDGQIVRTVPPNETIPLVLMWAQAGCKHLADKLLKKRKLSLLNKNERSKIEAGIILSVEGSLLGATPSQNELANQLLDKAQNPTPDKKVWKFDPLTGKPLEREEEVIPAPKATYTNPGVANVMSGLTPKPNNAPAIDLSTPDEPPVEVDKSKATREQVLAWARKTLPINFNDPETVDKLESMDLAELKRQLNYEQLA